MLCTNENYSVEVGLDDAGKREERERGEISGVRFLNRQEEMSPTHWWKDGPQEDSYLAVTGGRIYGFKAGRWGTYGNERVWNLSSIFSTTTKKNQSHYLRVRMEEEGWEFEEREQNEIVAGRLGGCADWECSTIVLTLMNSKCDKFSMIECSSPCLVVGVHT